MHEASDWWTGITISCSIEFGSKSDRILRAFLLSAKRFRLRAFQISGPTVKVNGSKLRYEIKYI